MSRTLRIAIYVEHGVVLLVGLVKPSVWLLGVLASVAQFYRATRG